ncbi:MAG TPA: hypothetical protein VH986_07900 [Acidimicrobiia bacterium]|jgi:hypothetical protein
MAKALECPACGAKHRLDGRDPTETFRCDRCGQKLKIPAAAVATTAAPAGASADPTEHDDGASAPAATAATGTVAPPPRRRTSSSTATEVIGVSAAATATDEDDREPPSDSRRRGARPAKAPRRRARWYWRLLAWIVAVPLGFVLTAWPAYEFGLIRKDDVLDVFVGSGTDRYARLAIVTLLWALVTAILVQLFIEGGRVWSDRRHRRRASASRTRPERTSVRGARTPG